MRSQLLIICSFLSGLSLAGLCCLEPLARGQDVHVRVSPDVKTGIEGTTEFPTIQMAMDHHPFAAKGADGKPATRLASMAVVSRLTWGLSATAGARTKPWQ